MVRSACPSVDATRRVSGGPEIERGNRTRYATQPKKMAAARTARNKARSVKRRHERFGEDETGLVVVGADMKGEHTCILAH